MPRPILLCTVGTSLIYPNLAGLRKTLADDTAKPDDKKAVKLPLVSTATRLADAYEAKDWPAVADALGEISPTERLCGAEVNSVTSLIANGYAPANCGIYFFHSDTPDGKNIADVLVRVYAARGHAPVAAIPVPDLQDQDPKRFRTKGLRNLAKLLCGKVREHSAEACAINATGGYKAQIAVAVLLGQALGLPVYYMHERFSEIIAFPPMPVSLDFEVWMRLSGTLAVLARETDPVPRAEFADEWDEKAESLIDATEIGGTDYLELSATGQIFHETFRQRFRTDRDAVLPPPAVVKSPPVFHDHGVINQLKAELTRHLTAVTQAVSCVTRCVTNYCNPDLPERNRFRPRGDQIEGIYSDGTRTVKFLVETTAVTPGQRAAAVAALNEWLADVR